LAKFGPLEVPIPAKPDDLLANWYGPAWSIAVYYHPTTNRKTELCTQDLEELAAAPSKIVLDALEGIAQAATKRAGLLAKPAARATTAAAGKTAKSKAKTAKGKTVVKAATQKAKKTQKTADTSNRSTTASASKKSTTAGKRRKPDS
jgi:hypothetical protein